MRSDAIFVHMWPPPSVLHRLVPAKTLAGPNLASLQQCDKFWIASRETAASVFAHLATMFFRPHDSQTVANILRCANQTSIIERHICTMASNDMWAEAVTLSYFYSTVDRCSLVDSCQVTGEMLHNAKQFPFDRMCRSRKGWQGKERVYNARDVDYYEQILS
jgi:hypothetical protein